MTTTISTNNVPRDLLYWHELTAKEQDWLVGLLDDPRELQYFRYRGSVYLLDDFVRIERRAERSNAFTIAVDEGDPLLHWDGALPESYWSGLVVRFAIGDDGSSTDPNRVVVGHFYID